MSIMLIRPMTPDTSRSGIVSIQYPINIGYLVSYLKKHGVPCAIRDFEVEQFSDDEFLESVRREGPVLVGFSCMTPHIMHASRMAGLIKSNFSETYTVVGGVHATAIPEQTLTEFPQFDFVVRGEGEQTLLELYGNLKNSGDPENIQGIAYRDGGGVKLTAPRPMIQDLDKIPFPDRDLINIELYRKSHVSRGFSRTVMNIAEIMCSRGCPYNCIFCASKVAHSRKVRFRSAENIMEEMKILIRGHQVNHFSFLDDTFTIKMDILRPVCEFMQSRRVTFDCFTRVNDIDEEKMSLMVKSGCRKISFGIESGSPRVLKLLKKGITVEHVERAFEIARKAKLPVTEATFMIGSHPDETLDDIEMTRKMIFKLNPDLMGLFITIPYPGTELNSLLKERGLLTKENWEEFTLFFSNPSWKLGAIPTAQLRMILKKTYRDYYLTPSYLLKSLKKIRSYKEFMYFFKAGVSFFKNLLFKKDREKHRIKERESTHKERSEKV